MPSIGRIIQEDDEPYQNQPVQFPALGNSTLEARIAELEQMYPLI